MQGLFVKSNFNIYKIRRINEKYKKHCDFYFHHLFFCLSTENKVTLKQTTLKGYTLYSKGLSQLSWRTDTDNFTYIDEVDKEQLLIQEGIKSSNKETILKLDEINSSLDNEGFDKLKKFPRFTCQDENTLRFWEKNNLFLFDLKSKKIIRLNTIKGKGGNKDLSVIKNHLY